MVIEELFLGVSVAVIIGFDALSEGVVVLEDKGCTGFWNDLLPVVAFEADSRSGTHLMDQWVSSFYHTHFAEMRHIFSFYHHTFGVVWQQYTHPESCSMAK